MRQHFNSSLRQTFLSLRTRNFRLYFIGQIISNSGNWLTNVALTLLILHLTNSGSAVGLLAACQYGPILFLTVWGGAIADRSDKHKLLFVTQSLEMIESFALAALAFSHHPPTAALYCVAAIGGVILAFDNPLRRSFVSEMVPKEDLSNAVALYSAIVNVTRAIGPALAGILVVSVGYGWCFMVDALSYIAVLTSLWMMRPEELHRRPVAQKVKGEVRAGLHYVRSTPSLFIPFIMLTIIGTLAYNFPVTLPLFVTRSLHGSVGSYTLIYSIFGFGALVSALIIASRNLVTIRYTIIGAFILGFLMLLLSIVPSVAIALPIAFFTGMASILYMNSTTASVQLEAQESLRGRVLALQAVLFIGTTPIGSPLLGWLADQVGARLPIVIGGIACLVAGAFGYIATKKLAKSSLNRTEAQLQ
jgi:MFS family permease